MSVKIKKRGSKWYVYVNYHGRRKNRAVGTREAAEKVRRALEARLALGDASFLNETEHEVPTFRAYAEQWLKTYADIQCKQSTRRSYEQLLRLHVMPRFGSKLLTDIRRDEVKRFVAELSQATREANDASILKFSRNTLRLIIAVLRAVLNAALEDGLVNNNPASKVGKFAKTEKPARQASAMNREETGEFLAAVREVRPRWYPFFLTALRAGLRKGELIALKWATSISVTVRMTRTDTFSCSGAITRVTSPRQRETSRGELISQNTCVASCSNCATSECSRPPLPDGQAPQTISCLRRRPEP